MNSENLQQIGENVKSQHRYWERLSPDERRTEVIKLCKAQAKTSRKNVGRMLIIGFMSLAASIVFWLWVFKINLLSTMGFVGGIILATIGFNVLYENRINSYYKILSNRFDDNDVIAYFREHEKTLTILQERAVMDISPMPNEEKDSQLLSVRDAAIEAIAKYWSDHPETLPLLRERAENDPTPWLREWCKELIKEIEENKN